MYCVKCGVRLQDGTEQCPLCGTPVWNPENVPAPERKYPDHNTPAIYRDSDPVLATAVTIACALAEIIILILCYSLYGELKWGGFAMLAIPFAYSIFILPLWFRDPSPVIFFPIACAFAEGYVLYVDLAIGGGWFLSFAFPVIGVFALLATAMIGLVRYIRHGKYYIFGGFFIGLGGYTILVEFFEHITFGSRMFRWSLFSASVLGVFGIFLLLAAKITPLRRYLDKKFFI